MKQIAFISGKGGTGKTVVSGALSAIPKKQVIADCDVDAANLHLLLHPKVNIGHTFTGGNKAVIDPDVCIGCGDCIDACRYEAITDDYRINSLRCEGCGLCSHVCPADAVRMMPQQVGEWFESDTRYGTFIHARLGVGEENSGKLTSHIKQAAKRTAREQQVDYLLIDGPPGIGCPVIATISGIDLGIIVTEPSLPAIHDLERIHGITRHFNVRTGLVINKSDLNRGLTRRIESYCGEHGIILLGKLSFSEDVENSVLQGIPLIEFGRNSLRKDLQGIWGDIVSILKD